MERLITGQAFKLEIRPRPQTLVNQGSKAGWENLCSETVRRKSFPKLPLFKF